MKRSLRSFFVVLALILTLSGFGLWVWLFSSNTGVIPDKTFVYIPTGSTYQDVLKILDTQKVIKNLHSFDRMARRMNYPAHVKPGKYQIRSGMGNLPLIQLLRGGKQTPVKLILKKFRTRDEIIHKLTTELEANEKSYDSLFKDTAFVRTYDLDTQQVVCLFLPDTYQFFWNTTAKKVVEKIARNYTRFWNPDRRKKAADLHLKPSEVMILASIIEEETQHTNDKPLIASTYLNRLRMNMPLQADPTVKFALQKFELKRVLQKHTTFYSPYNTYRVTGLPPGPICTPSKRTIELTLDAPQTNYLYFCASERFDGTSNFAATYSEHLLNAKKYQTALNQRGIR